MRAVRIRYERAGLLCGYVRRLLHCGRVASPSLTYDMRACDLDVVATLVGEHHGYGSMGATKTYAWAVYEDDRVVAAYAWQPPPVGAAKSVCPEAPGGVLALSRMVAVPRDQRKLRHVSTPLRRQMRVLIDRGRWPVLVTYSDEGQGHTGHVYKCSGWEKTTKAVRSFWLNAEGKRASSYANGKHGSRDLTFGGETTIQRWEHWVCSRGQAAKHMTDAGWRRIPIWGKVWKSGNQAYRWEQRC